MLLCYITGEASVERVTAALAAGVDYVQIRQKQMASRNLHEFCKQAASLPRAGRLLVNDRLDVALACDLDGIHLPAGRPAPALYRAASPRPLMVGISCHDIEEVRRAAGEGADFVLLAPIFSTPDKGPPLGLGILEQAAREKIPVLALGGITLDNARACMDAGAAGIAAIRLFEQAADIDALVRTLRGIGTAP